MSHVTHPLSCADISSFSSEIGKFCYIRKYRYRLASPGLLKIEIFQNKGYDVIIPDYDVTNEILSRDSNYVVDAVM